MLPDCLQPNHFSNANFFNSTYNSGLYVEGAEVQAFFEYLTYTLRSMGATLLLSPV